MLERSETAPLPLTALAAAGAERDVEHAAQSAAVARRETAGEEVGLLDRVDVEGAEQAAHVRRIEDRDPVELDEILIALPAPHVVADRIVVPRDGARQQLHRPDQIGLENPGRPQDLLRRERDDARLRQGVEAGAGLAGGVRHDPDGVELDRGDAREDDDRILARGHGDRVGRETDAADREADGADRSLELEMPGGVGDGRRRATDEPYRDPLEPVESAAATTVPASRLS